jgi:IS1 family transposase
MVAWQNNSRSTKTLQRLLDLIEHLPIKTCRADKWRTYSKLLPQNTSILLIKMEN